MRKVVSAPTDKTALISFVTPPTFPRNTRLRLLPAGACCPDCGDALSYLGEDTAEQLELVTNERDILKKASIDSIDQRNSHVQTCGCRGWLDKTGIYCKGISIRF